MDRILVLLRNHRGALILSSASAISLGLYLLISHFTYRLGFPLDDAWIHQTYARNLGLHGQFAFLPGQPSAGSTSPFWSLILAIGYVARLSSLAWTYFLGWICLSGLSWLGNRIAGDGLEEAQPSAIPWIGIFLAGEWHLVWAAGSGMETGLYAAAILLAFWLLSRRKTPPALVGAVCGLSVWIRPDGLTLIGPLLLVQFFSRSTWRDRFSACLLATAGFLAGFLPYLIFNQAIGGAFWPNTFFAKQAEYTIRLQEPWLPRFSRLLALPMIGPGILLLPGFLALVVRAWRKRQWLVIAAATWWLGYTFMYSVTLPVDYQHGRYLIPAMPVFFILGAAGTWLLIQTLPAARMARLVRFAAFSILALTWLAFILQGALAYREDVAIIETEMVDTGNWLAQNTPTDALVAAHDIGAVGYFSGRKILDLAGLVTPEVIPFLRDEPRLADFIRQRGAVYLVTFPGWYPHLVKDLSPVYISPGRFSPAAGGENMTVYRWTGTPP